MIVSNVNNYGAIFVFSINYEKKYDSMLISVAINLLSSKYIN